MVAPEQSSFVSKVGLEQESLRTKEEEIKLLWRVIGKLNQLKGSQISLASLEKMIFKHALISEKENLRQNSAQLGGRRRQQSPLRI